MKMRNFLLIFLFPLLIFSCSGGDVKITINVSNQKSDKVNVIVENQDHFFSLDKAGRATKTIYISKATYANVYAKNKVFTIYLQPNKDLDISFDDIDRYNRVFLYCDDGGINSYLATEDNVVRAKIVRPQRYSGKDYLKRINEVISNKREYLKSKNLPRDFVDIEKERIAYKTIEDIFYYPVYRKFFYKNKVEKHDEPYNRFIDSMFVEKPELFQLNSYTRFIVRYVEKITQENIRNKGKEVASHLLDRKELTLSKIRYAVDSISNQKVSDYVVYTFAKSYINQYGLEGNQEIVDLFRKNVRESDYKKEFKELIKRFERMRKGEYAPGFTFNDKDGNPISLKDYKGKYVLINIWSTWNYSCKREIFKLSNMQEEYKGRNITFINISIEENKNAWKRYLERRNLKGIHIYAGHHHEFFDDYIISGLPRFVLIDKEGKIITSQAPLPSSGKLGPIISSLKGL